MQVKKGDICQCSFSKNIGSGVKIYDDFKNQPLPDNKRSTKENHQDFSSSVSINGCIFEVDKESSSSIFYVHSHKVEIPVNVINCIFDGELNEDAHYIDGYSHNEENKKDSKLRIRSCKFSADAERAVNLKKSAILFDSSDNEYNHRNVYNVKKVATKSDNVKQNEFNMNLLTIVAVTACAAILVAIFAIKKKSASFDGNSDIADEILELNKNELAIL